MTPGSKRRIEAAAADLLSRSGYHGMGVKSLTEVTGLPAGSIYHHFPGGKEEITVAAIVWTSGLVRSMIEVVVADGVDAHAVRVLFAFMADRLEASAWTEGCVIGTPALDGSAASRPVGEACRVGYAAMVDPIAAALRREGWSRVAAHDLATTIVATYEGAAAMARVQRSRAPLVAAGEAMIRLLDHDPGVTEVGPRKFRARAASVFDVDRTDRADRTRTERTPLGVPLSVLDLVPVMQGSTPAEALANSVDLIRQVEHFGYTRYWVAEHHNMVGIASAATAVVIGHLAAASSTIRVGSGGIMLPNHSPMAIAEQFGTLETLYPGRIDLGLGRAPGTDQRTLRALRTDAQRAEDFPEDVQLLQALFAPEVPDQAIRAVPGVGLEVPLWILGSSLFGAQLAAALGLPFAFASHFAPDALPMALSTYRSQFRPSDQLDRPRAMVGLNVVAGETDDEARYLLSTTQQAFANLRSGRPGRYPPPVDDIEQHWSPAEKAQAEHMLRYAVVGGPDTVRAGIERVLEETRADELIVVTAVYEHAARVRSYEILADVTGIGGSAQPSYAGSSHQG